MTAPAITPADVREAALEALDSGLNVCPPMPDGSKRPQGVNGDGRWAELQERRVTQEEIARWYGRSTGLGLVCGAISGNLEAIDFDEAAVYEAYRGLAIDSGLGDLVERIEAGFLERSGGGAYHLAYRCEQIGGNLKLAKRPTPDIPGEFDTLIETRGEGGYIITHPSYGRVHPSGNPYVLLRGGFSNISTISPAERESLFDLAKVFDLTPQTPVPERQPSASTAPPGTRPGDHFNASADWRDILEPHGWKLVFERGGTAYWRRPGKNLGISATTNYQNSSFLYVFSTSTAFVSERGYSKFSAYALLEHAGDHAEAAQALAAKGYGAEHRPGQASTNGQHPSEESANLNDVGNAACLARLHRADLRYCEPWKSWLVYDGTHWGRDLTREVWRRARDVAHDLYRQAAEINKAAAAAEAPESQKLADMAIAFTRWAKKSQDRNRIGALVDLAKSEPGIPILPSNLDRDPYLLNCINGTVDLRTGERRDHQRQDLITKCCPAEYDPDAAHLEWERFLERVQPDPEVRAFLQRAVGYSVSGLTSEEVLFFCHGGTNTGKSTFLRAVCGALGEYSATADFGTFLRRDRPNGGHSHDIARLAGRRMVVSIEVDSGERMAESLVKQLTGGDMVTASHKFQESFQFVPEFKLWLAANDRPLVSADDDAIWRRILQVPFIQVIPPQERDPMVKATLADPAVAGPAVLTWAVQGFLNWQAVGLRPPAAVVRATEAYRQEVNPVTEFLAECCIADPQAEVSAGHLYEAYLRWAAKNGIKKPVKNAWFGRNLAAMGHSSRKSTGGKRVWEGLGLYVDVQEWR